MAEPKRFNRFSLVHALAAGQLSTQHTRTCTSSQHDAHDTRVSARAHEQNSGQSTDLATTSVSMTGLFFDSYSSMNCCTESPLRRSISFSSCTWHHCMGSTLA